MLLYLFQTDFYQKIKDLLLPFYCKKIKLKANNSMKIRCNLQNTSVENKMKDKSWSPKITFEIIFSCQRKEMIYNTQLT